MGVGEVKDGGGVEAKEVMDGEEGCIPWHLVSGSGGGGVKPARQPLLFLWHLASRHQRRRH
jgi:hypothetical protein